MAVVLELASSTVSHKRARKGPYPAPLEIETTPKTWSALWTEEVAMVSDAAEPIERWTAKRRVALVVRILNGETSVAEAARQHGLTVTEVEDWRETFLLGAENVLRSRPKDEEAVNGEPIKKLKQKIGDLVLDNDIVREALKPYPLDRKTSDA
jgi:transposase-like protein